MTILVEQARDLMGVSTLRIAAVDNQLFGWVDVFEAPLALTTRHARCDVDLTADVPTLEFNRWPCIHYDDILYAR